MGLRDLLTCSVDGCDRPYSCQGFCAAHYSAYHRSQDFQPAPTPSAKDRLFSGIEKRANGCWIWTKALGGGDGRGVIYYNGRQQYAHRVSWILFRGTIPDGLYVCHRCDEPRCINPDHLFLGTQTDNMRDCSEKGRVNKKGVPGEHNGGSKLTAESVRHIRCLLSDGHTRREIAEMFSVCVSTIGHIATGRTWKCLHN